MNQIKLMLYYKIINILYIIFYLQRRESENKYSSLLHKYKELSNTLVQEKRRYHLLELEIANLKTSHKEVIEDVKQEDTTVKEQVKPEIINGPLSVAIEPNDVKQISELQEMLKDKENRIEQLSQSYEKLAQHVNEIQYTYNNNKNDGLSNEIVTAAEQRVTDMEKIIEEYKVLYI